jgi:hypothetical protein
MSEPHCRYKDSKLTVGHQSLRFLQILRSIHYGALIPWAPVRGNGGESNAFIPLSHGSRFHRQFACSLRPSNEWVKADETVLLFLAKRSNWVLNFCTLQRMSNVTGR